MKTAKLSELNMRIGLRIYQKRLSQNMSQETLSEKANVSRNFISILENGNKSARIDTYYRIACALGISLCELFYDNSNGGITEIQMLLSNCSVSEMCALIEILRVSKKQFDILLNETKP